jgi:hypothetical protein
MRGGSHRERLVLASCCTLLLAAAGVIRGRTIYVDGDATGTQDGFSWTTAFQYLQDALAVVVAGDEIRVAQGQYRPDQGLRRRAGDREATFQLINGVTILGGFAGAAGADPDQRDPAGFPTILTGDLADNDDPKDMQTWGENSYRVVFARDAGSGTILDGLTITGGNLEEGNGAGMYLNGGGPVVRHCTILANFAYDNGSGVFCNKSDAVFVGCTFQENSTDDGNGGGLYNSAGNLRVEDCRFVRNLARWGAGALCNVGGSVQVINCEFVGNHSGAGAGTVESSKGSAVFFHCLFRGNNAYDGTGGIASSGPLSLLYCTFAHNYGDEYAGALACTGGATIVHCLFYANLGASGALFVPNASVSLDQCTFYDNFARAIRTLPPGTLRARGCILWANRIRAPAEEGEPELQGGYETQISAAPNTATFDYCCIEGWTPQRGGTGNLAADPLFVAVDQNDFHLQSQTGHWDAVALAWVADDFTSPCIDAGDPNGSLGQEPFPSGGIVNMGVYGGTCEASKSWFGAEPGPGVEAADLNGDGQVDAEDYRLALQRWPQVDQ